MTSTIDFYAPPTTTKAKNETQIILDDLIREVQSIVPISSGRKKFSNHRGFNRDFKRAFPASLTPLTHPQFEFIIRNANEEIGDTRDEFGRISLECVFRSAYALLLHQILVMYATSYGTSKALSELNGKCKWLNLYSEGSLIANDIVIRMLVPQPTGHGNSNGLEPLTSVTIRKNYTPAQVTVHLQTGIKQYIGNISNKHNVSRTALNPLATQEFRDETDKPRASQREQADRPYDLLRYAELKEELAVVIDRLGDRVTHQQRQENYDSEAPSYDEQALQLFKAWTDPKHLPLISPCKTFRAQCKALTGLLFGWSPYRSKIISNYLVNLFREHFQISNELKVIYRTVFADRITQRLRSKGQLHSMPRKDAVITKITSKRMEPKSYYVSHKDQEILMKILQKGYAVF